MCIRDRHREIHFIREVRKDVFAAQKQLRDLEHPLLLSLLQRLIDSLKGSPMSIPSWTVDVDRDSLLAETASLLKEREERID
eukprot:223146-Rhodomonas_salina.1